RQLHHEQLRPALLRQELDELLELQRAGNARPVLLQLLLLVGRLGEDPEAARPGREDRLQADVVLGVAELARRLRDRSAARGAPHAETRTVSSLTGRSCQPAAARAAAPARPRAARASSRASSSPRRPRSRDASTAAAARRRPRRAPRVDSLAASAGSSPSG